MPHGRNALLATPPVLAPRHQPSGLNSQFYGESLGFAEYVALAREMLAKVHADKSPRERAQAVAGNAPFEALPAEGFSAGRARPYQRGVLLIHGLTDSPYSMRHLAAFFQRGGFRVMAILLPGHGTQPGDLLDIGWQEWARAVAYGVEQLAREADHLYFAGYSAGATLAIRHSLLDERVRGLFLFSPALRVSPRAAWARLHKCYSWLLPAAKWVDIKPDRDIYKYESFPKNAAFQMHDLTRELRGRLQQRKSDLPVFAAASADDVTVDVSATLEFMARSNHPASRLVYYTTEAANCPAALPHSRVELVSSVVPAQNIVSFSHLSIALSPADPHYGAGGDYANCFHYYPRDMDRYCACTGGVPPVRQGEITERNLRGGVLRRLTYNPHFAALETSMQEFIGKLP